METFWMLALALGAVGFMIWPALRAQREVFAFSEEDTPQGRLVLRREILLGNLADLDFEYAMGKLTDQDYEQIREGLKRQAVHVMEQLDVLRESRAEASAAPAAGDPAPSYCSHCGDPLSADARFCSQCGSPAGRS